MDAAVIIGGSPSLLRQRRALLFADLVESVRLMHHSEATVIARWLAFVARVRVLIGLDGRLVKSYGDGLLLEFATCDQAVRIAFALHETMEHLNAGDEAPDSRMRLRVGIHVSEVVVDELDLFGVGVNLAARLATLANPGQTVVSAEVRDDISELLEWRPEDLGMCFVKHFHEPVRAYRVAARTADETPALEWTDYRPAVAVVPFTPKLPEDGSTLGDVIADEVIAAFAHQPMLRVVSRLSTGSLRGVNDPASVANEVLKVPFMLTGRYHVSGGSVALAVKLVDVRNCVVLWSESLHAAVADILHGQDTAVAAIVRCVSHAIVRVEANRSRRLPVPNLEEYALYVGAIALMHRVARTDFLRARELLEHLAARHPRSAAPRAQLAKWHVLELAQGWATDRAIAAVAADSEARRALDLDPQSALALAMRSAVIGHRGGDLDQAQELAQAATDADAQEPHAWLTLGAVCSWKGDSLPAERLPLQAIALSPLDPARFLFDVFVAAGKLAMGKAAEAVEAATASLRGNSMHVPSHRLLIVGLVLEGRIADARLAAQRLLQLQPTFRVTDFERSYAGRDRPHALERARALRAAGLPD